MYTNQQLSELRKAIDEYAAEQLMWQVLYINCVAQHSPALNDVRKKLLALPRTFELIMLNSLNSPLVVDLAHDVNEGNRLFIKYVDSVCSNKTDQSLLEQKINENIHSIAYDLHKINPQWGTAEWTTLINHEIELLTMVMNNAKSGNYSTWAEVLPIISRIKMDMAEYLAHGITGAN